jgi:ParB-like chromosome segregation protein Spo0J
LTHEDGLMRERGPVDLLSPARHIVTQLESVPTGTLSFAEVVKSYRHPNGADIKRYGSTEEILRLSVEKINGVELDNGDLRMTRPRDKVRYGREKIISNLDDPYYAAHAQLRDPFNPMSGAFAENVRKLGGRDNLEELRDSMRELGWVEELPAIEDERGVVLVGHRRLAVAKELGIEPVIKRITIGSGDAADAKRFKLAIASNIGAKPFTPEERKRIAEYLYVEQEWSMTRIGQALGMSASATQRDLEHIPTRPGRGIPLTEEKQQRILDKHACGRSQGEIAAEEGVAPSVVSRTVNRGTILSPRTGMKESPDRDKKVAALMDKGQSTEEIAAEVGLSAHVQIRCSPEEKELWKLRAQTTLLTDGGSLSDWLRALANAEVSYPWARPDYCPLQERHQSDLYCPACGQGPKPKRPRS